VTTRAVFFPFDLFGSGGAAAGVELLADAFREMLADNRRERRPTRARAYQGQVRVREFAFDTLPRLQRWREQGRRAVRQAWDRDEFLLWVTGNHLGALPLYDELAGRDDTLVVQLDAHLDIYNLTDCTEELSHGNFLLHCAGPPPPIINVGHRELLLPPEHVGRYYRRAIPADELARDAEAVVAGLRQAAAAAERVVIDLDCDVLDPAFFPATAQPLPFGLTPLALLRLLDTVWSERVAGLAVSEFTPARDRNDQSLGLLVWLLEYLLLRRYER
jgi:arginase family enzyme